MTVEDCFYLGRITRPHGLKGEVVIKLDTDRPEAYRNMEAVFLDFPEGLLPLFIEKSSLSGEFLRVKFEDVNDPDSAARLLRKEVWLPLQMLPELEGDQFYYHQIKGFEVFDAAHGLLGTVKQVDQSGAQPLLEIDRRGRPILIPLVDEFIDRVDKPNKAIYLTPPEGLVDFFLNEEKQ